MWHGCAKDLSVFFIYHHVTQDNWRCLYGYEWYLLSYSLRVYSNFSVPLLWGFHSGQGADTRSVSSNASYGSQ